MGIVSAVVTFIIIWWTAIFCVLPWGLKRDQDGTPNDPKMAQKLLVTTGISFLLLGIIYVLVEQNIIDFRSIARSWADEDFR